MKTNGGDEFSYKSLETQMVHKKIVFFWSLSDQAPDAAVKNVIEKALKICNAAGVNIVYSEPALTCSLYEIFDNQVFVIGGSFTDDQNDLVELLNERIAKESKFQLEWRSFPEIYIAQLKSDAGIIGASFMVQ